MIFIDIMVAAMISAGGTAVLVSTASFYPDPILTWILEGLLEARSSGSMACA
jgi:hypothetical protein